MHACWFSQQGHERVRNSDAAAVGQIDQYLLAVLVDGAEKGPRGAELARHWADTALQVLAEAAALPATMVNARLKQEQTKLRCGFLRDIASYCMVSVDLDTLVTQIWHCGDCRVGLRHPTEARWLTTPHILANQPGLPFTRLPVEQQRRQQGLTRSLNAKRFCPPEQQTCSLQQGQALLLSSDGYWQEPLETNTLQYRRRDDASLLTLPIKSAPLAHMEHASDSDNLRYLSLVL